MGILQLFTYRDINYIVCFGAVKLYIHCSAVTFDVVVCGQTAIVFLTAISCFQCFAIVKKAAIKNPVQGWRVLLFYVTTITSTIST